MFEGVDTLVLHDELALEDILPFQWAPLSEALPQATLARYAEMNVRMLQACLALDEQPQVEKPDEHSAAAVDLQRLDTKVNLLLDMVGRLLVQNQTRPPPHRVRFNARGASWMRERPAGADEVTGSLGVFEIYLHDCLIDPLRLAARVSRVTAEGAFEIKFERSPDIVTNSIDKFIFRRHRRRVADVRGPKKS